MISNSALRISFAVAVWGSFHTGVAAGVCQQMGGTEPLLTGVSSLGGAFLGTIVGTFGGGVATGGGNGNDSGLAGAFLGGVAGYAVGSAIGFTLKFSR